jgi:uncharacterized protein YndB with AHSA1/START domain
MITVEKSIVIGRPAGDVFAYVSDQTNAPGWQRGLLEVRRTTADPIGVGTRHTVVRTLLGRRLTLSSEYTRYEPNALVAFEWSGTMPGQASYSARPVGAERTRLTSRIEIRASGIFRIAEPLMAASLRRDVEANLRTLKGVLEATAGARAARDSEPELAGARPDREGNEWSG